MRPSVKRIVRYLCKRENALEFERVEDPRKQRGRRWKLRSLLTATFVSMVAQERSFRGVERLTRDMCGCRKRLGISRRVPDSTLARFYSRLDDEQGLRQVLIDDIYRAHRRKALAPSALPIGAVAIDGKTIWCGKSPVDDPACQAMPQEKQGYYRLHALHAVLVSTESQPCIDQMLVPAETNEMGAFEAFVRQLSEAYGRTSLFEVVTVDAGMTSAHNARILAAHQLRYVMALKETQPTLLATDVVLGEDERPWCTRGRALRMLSWLRLLAYNILRFLRHRYLRSERSRILPWDELRRAIQQAVLIDEQWDPEASSQAAAATL